jgi:hypothetical protein
MKQKTFLTPNYYGRIVKTVLTTFGPKNYAVAYFKDVADLVAQETANFTKLSSAKFSIETFQGF